MSDFSLAIPETGQGLIYYNEGRIYFLDQDQLDYQILLERERFILKALLELVGCRLQRAGISLP